MTTITPKQAYQAKVDQGEIRFDAQQQHIIDQLDIIYAQLIKRQQKRDSQVGQIRRKIKPRAPIHGLYLWGSVGIGKTFLIDTFYDCLPVKKMRIHFHGFMRQIHQQLTELQGQKNPLDIIAKKIADDYLVICFDEFFVSNITDAMLLSALFKALFQGGLCLVATSNVDPNELYRNGLQRQRFLPAIELIKIHTDVVHLASNIDYRLRHIQQAGVYYTPLDKTAEHHMQVCFQHYSKEQTADVQPIELLGRQVDIIQRASHTIWFSFHQICGRPRSQNDYLELCKHYHTLLVSDIPIIRPHQTDLAVSFINLIDVCYDAHVRVVISAAALPDELYPEGGKVFEFQRTISRLIEMQSTDYFDA